MATRTAWTPPFLSIRNLLSEPIAKKYEKVLTVEMFVVFIIIIKIVFKVL